MKDKERKSQKDRMTQREKDLKIQRKKTGRKKLGDT